MRTLLAWLVIAAGTFVGVEAGLAGDKKPADRGKESRPAPAECQTDSDCVLMTDGCCGCNEGGKQKAVPKNASEKLEKKRKSGCKQSMCTQMISHDASCSARAVCKENRCALGQ